MKTLTGNWFLCTIKHKTITDNLTEKIVSENYLVNAASFTEAETKIHKELETFYTILEVGNIRQKKYAEIHLSEDDTDDKYFEVILAFITIDEKTAKEKLCKTRMLTNADSLENAIKNINDIMRSSMADWSYQSVKEIQLEDIYE